MSSTKKLDFRKEQPIFYGGKAGVITEVNVPDMKFLMVDGKGDPNTAQEYKDAIETLYAVSYGVKMPFKKKHPAKDYVVPPLKGLWYIDDMSKFSAAPKSEWKWTMMVRVPDYVPDEDIAKAIEEVKRKKHPASIDKVRVEHLAEGKCVQALHIGPYDAEAPLIIKMHQWILDNGHAERGKHHEIYIGDGRKVAPEKLKMVLRQPFD
ncbi:MAG: GyrI-like domain-containing protein [Candidatus Sigynarchaeota archaeon]